MKLVKDNLYSFGLGFPIAKNFPYRDLINQAILSSLKDDLISDINAKWLDNICQPDFFVTSNIQLSIRFFGGLVFLLSLTILAALLFLIPETIWAKYFHTKVLRIFERVLVKKEIKK